MGRESTFTAAPAPGESRQAVCDRDLRIRERPSIKQWLDLLFSVTTCDQASLAKATLGARLLCD